MNELAHSEGHEPSSKVQPASGVDDRAYIKGALEAILMVVNEPVKLDVLAHTINASESTTRELLDELRNELDEGSQYPRGIQLREVGGGWRYFSHPRYADVVMEYVKAGQSAKLSVQALETLAVIAYRQPVTRAQIAAIRGVDADSVVRTLQTRGLIRSVGVTAASGATLYGTTDYFLERMGIDRKSVV